MTCRSSIFSFFSYTFSHIKQNKPTNKQTNFVGLPDAAAIEAASWVEKDNDRTVLIDASTAHRVNEDWTYGFPGTLLVC